MINGPSLIPADVCGISIIQLFALRFPLLFYFSRLVVKLYPPIRVQLQLLFVILRTDARDTPRPDAICLCNLWLLDCSPGSRYLPPHVEYSLVYMMFWVGYFNFLSVDPVFSIFVITLLNV